MNHLPDKDLMCPSTGFQKACRTIITEFQCPKFVQIRGKDPQSDKEIDKFGCVDSFLPMLLIENAQMQRHTGAAVESFRNEMVRNNEIGREILLKAMVAAPAAKFILENKS